MANKRVFLEEIGFSNCPSVGTPDRSEYHKRESRFRKYGLRPEQYKILAANQNNKCAVCKNVRPLLVDHIENRIRGLLCRSCNTMLGWYERHQELIQEHIDRTVARIIVEIEDGEKHES